MKRILEPFNTLRDYKGSLCSGRRVEAEYPLKCSFPPVPIRLSTTVFLTEEHGVTLLNTEKTEEDSNFICSDPSLLVVNWI